jgi:D-serine deaminase-like pyridoxal phosphate-dependent protein
VLSCSHTNTVYPRRGPDETPEYLVNAGTLALGREPVGNGKFYNGWGILMPWGPLARKQPFPGPDFPRITNGWRVQRISQEHGIVTWKVQDDRLKGRLEVPKLEYGQRVRIWPNHSCIAGACYDWYLIVDSRREGKEDEVVDVWPRWRGW